MDKIDRVKELINIKKTGVEEGNIKLVSSANKSLNSIIKDGVKKAQESIGAENIYKEYVNKNNDYINESMAINADVNTIQEAIGLINQVDFRYIFGFDVLLGEAFECTFINKEQRLSFAFSTEIEADKAVEREIAKYHNKEIILSGYQRFGMYVREFIIKHENAEAWISYSDSRNKYLYMVGSNDIDNYVITHTFDILDLYQIFTGLEFQKAVQELCELLNIRIKELNEIRNKYIRNKELINTSLIRDKFPILYELIGDHIVKIEAVLNEGIYKLYYHKKNNNNWVFSSSMSHLAKKMNVKSKSTVNAVTNTLVLLGFFTKIEFYDGEYLKGNRNKITYFYVNEFNEALYAEAEEKAKIMLYDGERITATGFSYVKCSEKFGEETTNLIFKDKVTKAKAS